AAGRYEVSLFADDAATPFRVERVEAGPGRDRLLPLPELAPGAHRVTAVARFHGWRATSGTLRLVVSASGASEDGPAGSPPPVAADRTPGLPAPAFAPAPSAGGPAGGPAGGAAVRGPGS